MTATNHDKSSRLQLSGRNITGACLAVCGLLIIIWGGTLESVSVTDPGFMSFAVSGLVIVAVGAGLATALPRAARVALIWLATLTSMFYLFIHSLFHSTIVYPSSFFRLFPFGGKAKPLQDKERIEAFEFWYCQIICLS